jgi:hypothetical protein
MKLMSIMNPEHAIVWPETFESLMDYLIQLHPESKSIQYMIFMTALGEKRVYNQDSYQAMVPALRIYDGNIHVFSVMLWRVVLPGGKTINYSSHVELHMLRHHRQDQKPDEDDNES